MRKYLLPALALLPVLAGPCPAGADEVSMNKAGVRELMEIEDGIISRELAERIVKYREENGPFRTEKDLLRVPDLNPCAAGYSHAGGRRTAIWCMRRTPMVSSPHIERASGAHSLKERRMSC